MGREKQNSNLNPPWEKGQSGNPDGKPTGSRNTKTVIKELLEIVVDGNNPITDTDGKFTAKQIMIMTQIKQAMEGNIKSAEFILNRLDGMPSNTVHLDDKTDLDDFAEAGMKIGIEEEEDAL